MDTFKNLPWLWIVVCVVGFIVGLFVVHQFGSAIFPSSVESVRKTDKSMKEVTLHFVSGDGKHLTAEFSAVRRGSLEDEIFGVMEDLIKGSGGALDPVMPVGTRILGVKVDGNTALVDFSFHLKNKHWGGSTAELLTVYSIVNSVVFNFKSIEKVQILIEGERFKTLSGHIKLDKPLGANREMIEG